MNNMNSIKNQQKEMRTYHTISHEELVSRITDIIVVDIPKIVDNYYRNNNITTTIAAIV